LQFVLTLLPFVTNCLVSWEYYIPPTDKITRPDDEDIYIYRRGNPNSPKAVALYRDDDHFSGLSFSTLKPNERYLKYGVRKLTKAGYNVRFDRAGSEVKNVLTGELPGIESKLYGRTYGNNHVTVSIPDRSRWDNWFLLEGQTIELQLGIYKPSPETVLLYNLREQSP